MDGSFHHDIPEVTTVEFFALLNPAVRQQINDLQDPDEQRQRPGFRPRSQKKGKGYLAEDQYPDDQIFYGKKGKKGGKKG